MLSLLGLAVGLDVDRELSASSAADTIRPKKRFEVNATWDSWAADGVHRQQILLNGQFPGPALIMDEGGDIKETVSSFMPFNTTIYFHGIE